MLVEFRLFDPDQWLLGFAQNHGIDPDHGEFHEFEIGCFFFSFAFLRFTKEIDNE